MLHVTFPMNVEIVFNAQTENVGAANLIIGMGQFVEKVSNISIL